MADSEDEDRSLNLTGFLFGNINEKGELEDTEILDEESRRHLSQLSSLSGLGSLVQDIAEEGNSQTHDSTYEANNSWIQKDSSATDYSDITELAEEEEEKYYKHAVSLFSQKKGASFADDYDADNEREDSSKISAQGRILLPTVAPAASTLSKQEKDRLAMPPPPAPQVSASSSGDGTSDPSDPDKPALAAAPLAGTVGSELLSKEGKLTTHDGKTVTDLFPEFRPGQVLRFSRLFGPAKASSMPQQWRNAKKRKKKKKKQGEDEKTVIEQPKTPPSPRPEDCMSDDEDKLMAPWEPTMDELRGVSNDLTSSGNQDGSHKRICEWRNGPAALWYEMLGVNEDGTNLDYGFKLKQKPEDEEDNPPSPKSPDPLPSVECFEMVSQVNWEDDIIWSLEDVKPNLQAQARAGWIPTQTTRTAHSYAMQQEQLLKQLGVRHPGLETFLKNTTTAIKANTDYLSKISKPAVPANEKATQGSPTTWYSIFPVENVELVYGNWEDKIIWDAENMSSVPSPTIMQLDPSDENIIMSIPEDSGPLKESPSMLTPKKETKKSKLLLGKNNSKEDEGDGDKKTQQPQKDKFNLSNDEYYTAKNTSETSLDNSGGSNLVQHSLPSIELQRPYFPTYMSVHDLRSFHRSPLQRVHHGPLSKPGRHPVYGLLKHIKKKAREREKERLASGGGEMFFMRTPTDLTGMDGSLVLFEYCEEYPPLIMAVGMNTKIRNYYKRKPGKDDSLPSFDYGEAIPVHQTSPFLGQLAPGESLQALENNLYRAPIYQHMFPETDFVVVRNSTGYYIRDVKTIFTVGQECPKFEVPGPNSKKANIHARDFLQIFIYRLFWKSPDTPRRIKMDDIKRAFPMHSESSIRKRLKLCADFKRTGIDCNWWVLKNDFRLPTEEEMRALVSPEQCCAYYSMLAAEQRLKDAGYGEKSLFSCEDDNDDSESKNIDDEVRTAPWNTTRAFISAMKGKCQLAVTGSADPTGCGEGFSYVRVPNKPMASKEDSTTSSPQIRKQKTVTGTDADLRRLSLKQARQVLRNFGVSDEEIRKLSRWEVIHVVRTMSTEAAKSGEEGMSKFARGSRFTIAEHQERYKEECQRIFDLQNKVLTSIEVLSTDEESSSDEGSDIDELGKNLESMLANKKTSMQLTHEEEEAERRELQKLLSDDKPCKESNGKSSAFNITGEKGKKESKKDSKGDDDETASVTSHESSMVGRRLRIKRTFKTADGKQFVRIEVVKNQAVIDAYLKFNKDKNVKAQFASVDEIHKEEIRREKRRIQEQLRRIKRNQEKEKLQPVKKKKEKPPNNLKCGACGAIGHMRTNKNCPNYQEANPASVVVAMTDEQVAEEELNMPQDDLVKVEGTKITLGKAFLDQTNELKRKSLVLRFPKESVRKKRRSGVMHCDYLKKPRKSVNRRRANPEVALQVVFEGILNKMKDVDETWPFHHPVSAKGVPDYHRIVKIPMDLQTMRENLRKCKYLSREEFLEHATLIATNSILYNGANHAYTATAQKMLEVCNKGLADKEEEIIQLEKEINPLLSDDPQIAFSFFLENLVAQIKALPESWPFHKPVSSKQVPDYYDVVKTPIDLLTIRQQVQGHAYQNREEFLEHVRMMHGNSVVYNGENHDFSKMALKVLQFCEDAFKENEEQLSKLENEILLIPGDDTSSYAASQPPSVAGPEWSTENSMDDFPEGSIKEDDSMMDGEEIDTTGEDYPDFRAQLSTPMSAADQSSRLDADFDDEEEVDVEGYEDEALSKQASFGSQQQLQEREQDSQDASQFESILLQDLEHSESESEEDDFPFGDGDDEEEEDIEEEPMNFSPGADENSNDNSMNTETGNLSGEDI
ncbi:transcription initiation factor TFIID subunit 1-like isoform X2 [Acropora palmata]|uniref:transcription initiation factor TFIID subunit 1-like isoform X2 n=1 Tax=Acropora palmata TaxID=6131 RepID=UPI003D9FE6BB